MYTEKKKKRYEMFYIEAHQGAIVHLQQNDPSVEPPPEQLDFGDTPRPLMNVWCLIMC